MHAQSAKIAQNGGHYSKGYKLCKQGSKSPTRKEKQETGSMSLSTLCGTFVVDEIEKKAGLVSKADSHMALVGSKKGRVIPITHHIFSAEIKPQNSSVTSAQRLTECT